MKLVERMVAVHPMTYPYYELPPGVHEGLADIFEGGGFESVEPISSFTYSPGITGPELFTNPDDKNFEISDGNVKLTIGSSYDRTFDCYVAYLSVSKGSRRDGKQFLFRVEHLLYEHGVVKK